MKIHLPAVGPDLPIHPRTGMSAIGLRRNGDPIWPVLGGAPDDDDDGGDDDQDDDTGDGDDDTGDDKDADKLSDAGKQALDRMKVKWRAERDARKALAEQVATLTAGQGKTGKDDQSDPDEIRKQARAEATAETLKDRALDKVETKAAKLFADPEDARALLAGKVDDFIDDGKVDLDAINEALEDLLKKKPHLAAATARRFAGGADGGARKGSTGPAQLTEQDLKRMSPQQIDKARLDGKLADLLGAS